MIREGQVVLFKFPQTDQAPGKLRPALIIREIPGSYSDWLICMISSQLPQQIPEFDEVVRDEDTDFGRSGLKTSSVIRISRLAVINKKELLGFIIFFCLSICLIEKTIPGRLNSSLDYLPGFTFPTRR